ncbi:MAG: type IV pilus twitching motility protein PilT [bacterium]
MPKIDAFFKLMKEQGASDLHMVVGDSPKLRLHGELAPIKFQKLDVQTATVLIYEIMTQEQRKNFEEIHDLDFSYELPGIARFRCNTFMQRNGIGAVFRIIPTKIKTITELNLPPIVSTFAELNKGLVLVTGPTGSGKSTTLAAIINHINETKSHHILTIEDPIEFVHENKKSLVRQREVENHTESFSSALKAALREDPDVILVGEMRDLETISLAITAAETGHLVFGTLHTNSAPKTIDRIIDAFPTNQQAQIKTMLSESLKGVVAQQLLKTVDGKGRCAAIEVLLGNIALANMIREGKTFQIPSFMQTNKNQGMILMDDTIMNLLNQKKITPEEAYEKAIDKKFFEDKISRV